MDSLFNILSRKDFDEPPESVALKTYIKNEFKVQVGVQVREKDIIISVSNSSLANALRLRSPEIKKVCHLDKRLIFRISG